MKSIKNCELYMTSKKVLSRGYYSPGFFTLQMFELHVKHNVCIVLSFESALHNIWKKCSFVQRLTCRSHLTGLYQFCLPLARSRELFSFGYQKYEFLDQHITLKIILFDNVIMQCFNHQLHLCNQTSNFVQTDDMSPVYKGSFLNRKKYC